MTLAEMRGRMSSREFASWIAYDRIQPIGDRRLDLNFAQLRAQIAAALGGKRVTLAMFDPFDDSKLAAGEPGGGRSMEDQKADAIKLTRLLGGKVINTDPEVTDKDGDLH